MIDTLNIEEIQIPDIVPLLPIRDIVIFPFMIVPLFVGREMSVKSVDEALSSNRMIMLVAQKDGAAESPSLNEIYSIGTVAMIMRMLKLPDGRVKILVQGLSKAKISDYTQTKPFYKVKVEVLKDEPYGEKTSEVEALMRNLREQLQKVISLGQLIPPDILLLADNLEDPGRLADIVVSNLNLKVDDAQKVLETLNPIERIKAVSEYLNKELEVLTVKHKIQTEAKDEMSKTQREYFLREQLKAIQKELGEVDEKTEEINEFRDKIKKAKMPEKVKTEADKQLGRLERMHPDAAEASLVRTYLDSLAELPWNKSTKDNLDIKKASKVLNEDHYDLEKVKERILEYLSVCKLKKEMKGPILCFVGPPGVGKTSLGRSIARALRRKFARISLGGIKDEAEIRGHRRTYVGALPGKIIQGIKQAGSNNPVFMMDEIDKVGTDFRGDPSSALLEVLDPEQNDSFTDHYLALPFDLSKVMFITTANLTDPIPSALKDRMETLYLSGYTDEEKLMIARKYIIPRQLKEHGLTEKLLSISNSGLSRIISDYTREAGLRNLEREVASVIRKVAKKVAGGKKKLTRITASNIENFLGVQKYLREGEQEFSEIGVTTGLAWTPAGGEIIYIEATTMKGRGNLTLTGQLGDVMQESAKAALSYSRAQATSLGIKNDFFSKNDIHIHVPAGATPKDGPSAGITMATALISVLTRVPVSKDVAMTGEVTLRGRVLPIGGVKEKILAAKRAGLLTVILPKKNEKDLIELPKNVRKGMEFIFADTMNDVLEVALKKEKRKIKRKNPQ
ncbi:MAG: endopeptidase La [Candidatus Schekmanbacteria bacterium GWA2_38_9]|uniref:Lon protease n=1 Tax=Candidatus Schekmanbacteria bacterium RIFCSPLOWO2_12_FULL_38_15 TaxID=1817883 RepID=A0A1F7SPJ9_9BACT|nr:MAG: endopeptidase La [Candidatus Schekmanbacteria bacterium GWA2_38_9]OGL51114.1 MAG: endopeptidase La [Candidatus Schekmanbacteria bacterium RIFCSPLOWO2_02_FULL_38_14]OGL55114.1 MAG: endopeptidase La [Candidatus Schekmanbacteria bacterium RIFCSPLOWO2_12_FULL_38_15]